MIKLEHAVLPSPEQMQFVIEGMRNPMNSWNKSDSGYRCVNYCEELCNVECTGDDLCPQNGEYKLGDNDHTLMLKLAKAGADHRKYLRMIPVYVRITAPLYWWKEFDTYKVGTVANSCSTMHKISEKEFTWDDFSVDHLKRVRECSLGDVGPTLVMESIINGLNYWRRKYLKSKSKDDWWQMIQLLPSSYNQTRNVMLNYEVLANIYKSRRTHKLDEWRGFCKWIEALPYADLIVDASGITVGDVI